MTTTLREDWRAVRKGLQGVAKGLLSAAGAAVDGRLAQLEASIIDGVGAMFVSAVEAARNAPISEADIKGRCAATDRRGYEAAREALEAEQRENEALRAAAEAHEKEVARLKGEAAARTAQLGQWQQENARLHEALAALRYHLGLAPGATPAQIAEAVRSRAAAPAATLAIDGRLVRRLMGEGEALALAELEQLQRHLDAALAEVVGAIDAQHQRLSAPTAQQLSAAGAESALLEEDLAELDGVDRRRVDPADEVVERVNGERVARREWLIEIAREILHHHSLAEGPAILRRAAAALGGEYPAHTPVHAEGWASCVARARQLQRQVDAGTEQAQRREVAA